VDYLARRVMWRRARTRVFVHAACVDHEWWVLRLNDFPDHPLYTLFVGGVVVGDVQDLPVVAPAWDLDVDSRIPLNDVERGELLTLMRGLGPYGSEVGQPCDGDWCWCARMTDEHVAEVD
jgi:hypothetical protein